MANELPSTPIGTGMLPIQQQGHPSTQDDLRKAINKALALLTQEQRDRMANVEVVPGEKASPKAGKQVNGYVQMGDPNIYLVGRSPFYEDAQKGKPNSEPVKSMAAGLLHEQYHLDHGTDEAGAYDAQIEMLRRLGADPKTIQGVLDARAQVTQK